MSTIEIHNMEGLIASGRKDTGWGRDLEQVAQ